MESIVTYLTTIFIVAIKPVIIIKSDSIIIVTIAVRVIITIKITGATTKLITIIFIKFKPTLPTIIPIFIKDFNYATQPFISNLTIFIYLLRK